VKLERLREWRESKGLTQKELAAAAKASEFTVARAESGEVVRPNTARRLAEGMGVSVSDLLESPPVSLTDPLAGAGDSSSQYTEGSDLAKLLESLGAETTHLARPNIVEELENAPLRQLIKTLGELDEEIALLSPELARLRQEVKKGDPGYRKFMRIWSEAAQKFLGLKMSLRARAAVEPEEVKPQLHDFVAAVP
jgi:transcriptional regulator with XRE-family HTH domain